MSWAENSGQVFSAALSGTRAGTRSEIRHSQRAEVSKCRQVRHARKEAPQALQRISPPMASVGTLRPQLGQRITSRASRSTA
jgi:hypothetical protein